MWMSTASSSGITENPKSAFARAQLTFHGSSSRPRSVPKVNLGFWEVPAYDSGHVWRQYGGPPTLYTGCGDESAFSRRRVKLADVVGRAEGPQALAVDVVVERSAQGGDRHHVAERT